MLSYNESLKILKETNALLEGQIITINKNHPNSRKKDRNVDSLFLEANDILIIEGEIPEMVF